MLTVAESKTIATQRQSSVLKPGPEWASFEQLRIAGSLGLDMIGTGQAATLRTKAGVFRVLRDEDFQSLVGSASEVDRLKNGLTTLKHALKVVREHPASTSAVDLLLHIAAQFDAMPVQPVRRGREPLVSAETIVPEDDEFILDPVEVKKRAGKR